MKPITVITITYNSAGTILSLLQSINNAENIELVEKIIIIENNSPDKNDTCKLISQYSTTSRIKIELIKSSKNNGFAKSCNLGAKISKSKYVLFLNPDTELMKGSLKVLYKHSIEGNVDIIGGISVKRNREIHKTVVRNPNLCIGLFELSSLGKIFRIKKGHSDFYYEDMKYLYTSKIDVKVDAIGGAYLMVNRVSFNKLKGFDEKFFMYLEDVDLGVRANEARMKVVFCPHSKIKHIGGASSLNKHRIRHQAWYDSRKYYYKKHYGVIQNAIIQPLYSIEEVILKLRSKYL